MGLARHLRGGPRLQACSALQVSDVPLAVQLEGLVDRQADELLAAEVQLVGEVGEQLVAAPILDGDGHRTGFHGGVDVGLDDLHTHPFSE